ncbi:ATP-binding protein [Streptacidiphilus jiangxiensis]|uniref:Histidine kinase-like ATPase domain-containing protein n=1 Tax=Streptacidiphilus jiangxiensis TaxID=235985 RepID=A0A1H7MAZ8_STRJI|nr:ATP-binding protein [Streptacidiphilus jiangxiensis]SEL08363.1 Histidine kinase-like ATPase domain-containing protein [Streptacidiphilus jiangxiensis]
MPAAAAPPGPGAADPLPPLLPTALPPTAPLLPDPLRSDAPQSDPPQSDPPQSDAPPSGTPLADLLRSDGPASDTDLPTDLSRLGSARSTWAMDRQAAATFAAEAASVARARRFVRITAAMWRLRPETLADTELCMSELVGNAIRHTGSRRLHCRLWSARGLVFVEVDDEDAHDIPRVERPAEDDECGRGLLLITTFAAAWGSVPRPGQEGKTVWAAFPLPR